MNKVHRYNIEKKNSDTIEYTLCTFIYIKNKEKAKNIHAFRNQDSNYFWRGNDLGGRHGRGFRKAGNFLFLFLNWLT